MNPRLSEQSISSSSELDWRVLALLVGILASAAALVAGLPLGVSIVAVFLFAGPHNWFEARYFLGRLPARFGPLRGFFLAGFVGTLLLTAAFTAIPELARRFDWSDMAWNTSIAAWNTALILWIAGLTYWRSRTPPCRDWPWIWPIAWTLVAVNWLAPLSINLALVYLHPLLALVFLDRELGRRRSPWRTAYRTALVALPLCLAAIAWAQYGAPPLPGDDVISLQIQRHVGADSLPSVSPRLLVAWHAYLELLHYGVWVLAVPLVGVRTLPWKVANTPLGRRSFAWRGALTAFVLIGGAIVFALWGAFLVDYPLTRDIYFTVALLHVLAEAPLLLRAL